MAEEGKIKIRVRVGANEAEIEAPPHRVKEAIEFIPEVLARLPRSIEAAPGEVEVIPLAGQAPVPAASQSAPVSMPAVSIEKGDSLSEVISKFFSDQWGRSPRKLMEVRDALQSYGLNYPKQSVAVALLRLAKSSKIRRFKGESGEYVYTASTGAVRFSGPVQPAEERQPLEAEAPPIATAGEGEEEQLDLDAPAAN